MLKDTLEPVNTRLVVALVHSEGCIIRRGLFFRQCGVRYFTGALVHGALV